MNYTVRTFAVYTDRDEWVGVILQNGVEVYRTLPQVSEITARRDAVQWLHDFVWRRV